MTLTLSDVFKKIEDRLAKVDPNDRKVKHIFKLILTEGTKTGPTKVTWMLDLVNVKLYEGDVEAEITLKMADTTMIDIMTGTLDSTKALNEDMIDIEGNYELVLALKPYISSV
jgi:putative sterol carrier protein